MRRGLRVRDHVVIVEPLAECGVRGDLGVPDAEIGIGGIVAQPVLARAALDLRHALAAEPFVGEQGQRGRRGRSARARIVASAMPSSID